MQDRGCDICMLWFSFMSMLHCLCEVGCIKEEIRFVLGKVALSLFESVLNPTLETSKKGLS